MFLALSTKNKNSPHSGKKRGIMKNSELKKWLDDFIERWEENEQEACGYGGREPINPQANVKEDALTDEYREFCEENSLPSDMSANELLSCFDGDYFTIKACPENDAIIQEKTGIDWHGDHEELADTWYFDDQGRFALKLKDGTFWTIAIREDAIFNDVKSAFDWLDINL